MQVENLQNAPLPFFWRDFQENARRAPATRAFCVCVSVWSSEAEGASALFLPGRPLISKIAPLS